MNLVLSRLKSILQSQNGPEWIFQVMLNNKLVVCSNLIIKAKVGARNPYQS